MQSFSRSPNPISVDSESSYHTPRVLCNTNRVHLNLADLYHEQQQLTICSTPPRTQPHTSMSSISSPNGSNESPNECPVLLPPQIATAPSLITLSPHTIQTTLQTQPDLDTTLLRGIANSLLQTIANCEANTAISTKWYEDQLHHLEQKVLHYEATFNEPPMGYVLNNGKVSDFHIPISSGLYQEAKWIWLNDDGTISGHISTQCPNEQPHIIDLYVTPNYSVDLPITALPAWFCHLLTELGGNFHLLQNMVAETDNWGLAREITRYRQIDDDITHLAVKVKEYQRDLEAAWANLTLYESCLMFAQAAEHVKTLRNVPRKMTAVHSGWKSAHGVQATYVRGRPL
jgi:hypothetical protein